MISDERSSSERALILFSHSVSSDVSRGIFMPVYRYGAQIPAPKKEIITFLYTDIFCNRIDVSLSKVISK